MLLDLIRSAIASRIEPGHTGITLSGGLDSSTIAALAPADLPTFSAYYDVPGFDERRYSRLAAHAEHHEIEITPQDVVNHLDWMVPHLRRPWQGPGTIGQFIFAHRIRELRPDVRVLLSGEGSDELFGGYARTLLAAGEPLPDGYEGYVPPADYPVTDLRAALQYDLDRLPDLLAVDDQVAAPWGLEARAAFTDLAIVDYALALPTSQRVGKRHLRNAVRGIVPDAIIDRTDKMGMPIPMVLWSQSEPLRSLIGDRLGYLPDPERPWDRGWWYDLLDRLTEPESGEAVA
jgi:asparagine synthetase B (glutamine-hydrolysing)